MSEEELRETATVAVSQIHTNKGESEEKLVFSNLSREMAQPQALYRVLREHL